MKILLQTASIIGFVSGFLTAGSLMIGYEWEFFAGLTLMSYLIFVNLPTDRV